MFKQLHWLFDYWVLDVLYGPYGQERYYYRMLRVWGSKYAEKYIAALYTRDEWKQE